MSPEEASRYLKEVAEELGEHFEAVQIMATWSDGQGSRCIQRGSGNWYARQGMAHEFINQDVAHENAKQIARAIAPDEENEEE